MPKPRTADPPSNSSRRHVRPRAFRAGGTANRYPVEVLDIKDVAVIGDTAGHGMASVMTPVPMLKTKGANAGCARGLIWLNAMPPEADEHSMARRSAGWCI